MAHPRRHPLPQLLLPLVLLLLALPAGARAAGAVVADTGFTQQHLTAGVYRLQAGDGGFDAVQRLPDSDWQELQGTLNLGFYAEPVWLRTDIRHADGARGDLLLEIEYPLLDELDVLVQHDGRTVAQYRLGDMRPRANAPVHHRHFIVPLHADGQAVTRVFLRAQTSGTLSVPLRLWSTPAFIANEQSQLAMRALLYGSILTTLAVFLLVGIATREGTYFWYVVFILGLTGYQATIDGITQQYLWPGHFWWHAHSIPFMLWAALACALAFTLHFLDLPRTFPRTLLPARLAKAACFAALAATPFVPVHAMYFAVVPAAMGLSLLGVGMGLAAWREGVRGARFYVLALSSFLVGAVFAILRQTGPLAQGWLAENALLFAIFVQVLLLSWALAQRLREEKLYRVAAQDDMLAAQIRHTTELEHKVNERTDALQRAMDQLEMMNFQLAEQSRRDGLTGLHNRRHFDERYDEIAAQAVRRGEPVTVMMMDIDHFKKLNDTYGHAAGDQCLRETAEILRTVMRGSDLVARYGGEEFVLVLPNTDIHAARPIAERLRQRIEQSVFVHEGTQVRVTTSLGVAASVPASREEALRLLTIADDALYAAKRNGRNRVETLAFSDHQDTP